MYFAGKRIELELETFLFFFKQKISMNLEFTGLGRPVGHQALHIYLCFPRLKECSNVPQLCMQMLESQTNVTNLSQ